MKDDNKANTEEAEGRPIMTDDTSNGLDNNANISNVTSKKGNEEESRRNSPSCFTYEKMQDVHHFTTTLTSAFNWKLLASKSFGQICGIRLKVVGVWLFCSCAMNKTWCFKCFFVHVEMQRLRYHCLMAKVEMERISRELRAIQRIKHK